MITAATWIPRGIPAQHPTRYAVDDAEIARISELAQAQLDDAREGLAQAREGRKDDDDDDDQDMNDENDDAGVAVPAQSTEKYLPAATCFLGPKLIRARDPPDELAEYQLSDYDADEAADPISGATEGVARLNILGNVRSLAYHAPGDADPYITLPSHEDDDSDADERAELEVLPSDNLLVTARVADEVAQLEVYVYEDGADNLYVHHDVMLPAIPLCVERLEGPIGGPAAEAAANGKDGEKGRGRNFVAVGTFDPDIEIWDLDTVDGMYPAAILGASSAPAATDEPTTTNGTSSAPKKKKKKKKRSKKPNAHHHVAAVLALAANPNHAGLLASASADATVKLWDLTTTACAHSYDLHTDKACALDWHPRDTSTLLSGGYDRRVVAADMRAPGATAPAWEVDGDVDAVRWDPHAPERFYATTEAGSVYCFDRRASPSSTSAAPLWTLHAHDKSLSAFDANTHVPGLLATGSTDKSVKLWRVGPEGPALVARREMKLGKVFAARWAPDEATAFRLAVAGSKGSVQVWDTSTNAAVRRAFAERGLREGEGEGEGRERLVGVAEDSESSESDEDGGGEGMEED